MRHSKRLLLSTLSLFTLMIAATPTAYAKTSYGLVVAEGKWKVGTVNTTGEAPYCSMVNKYDKNVVLAFSRNADGESSIAIAFNNEIFTPGTSYDVTMQTDVSKKPRKYKGRANSEHAIIMQMVEGDPLSKSLGESSSLKVSLDQAEASFALHKFGTHYSALVDCAGALHAGPKTPAVPVANVDKEVLPGSVASKTANASAALLKTQAEEKAAKFEEDQKIQDQLKQIVADKNREIVKMQMAQKELDEQTAQSASKTAGEMALRILELQKERDMLQSQVAENNALKLAISQVQADKAISDTQIADLERSLLVATQEKQELAARIAAQDAQAKQQQEVIAAKDQDYIAAKTGLSVNAEKLTTLQTDYNTLKENNEKLQTILAEKTAQVTAMETQLAEHTKNLPVMFKTAADLAAKKEETVQLQQQLEQSLAERQAAISSAAKAQSERDALNSKLSSALTQSAQGEQPSKTQQQLAEAQSQVVDLKARLEAQSRQTKLLEQALKAKEKVMASHRRDIESRREEVAQDRVDAQVKAAKINNPVETRTYGSQPTRPSQPHAVEEANGFLEKIMSHHQPGAAEEPAPQKVQNSAAASAAPAAGSATSGPPADFATVIIQ